MPDGPSNLPDVYVIDGVAPEINAYAMAKYSRSALSMRESLREMDGQKAEKFLNTFYFQYGHRSIADLAHLSIAVERLSILAAIEVADETRWDGQERSTRYQEFRRSSFITPPEAAGNAEYTAAIDRLFASYEQLSPQVASWLEGEHARPEAMTVEAYRRTLRARAFDVSRYLLPLATATSLGQIVSARTLEQQISRLLSSPWGECRQVGAALKQAASAPGAVPTLVKYTDPSAYREQSRVALAECAAALLDGVAPDSTPGVRLVAPRSLESEIAASLLYPHCHHSYSQILATVEALPASRREEIIALGTRHRGPHDELAREFQAGAPFQFDILMDIGGFRDLHRHRRCVQLHQDFTFRHGYETPEALGACGGSAVYHDAMQSIGRWAATQPAAVAAYGLPLGYYKRSLFKMDWAEAAYIAELRTGPAGHFSYRAAAWAMFEAMRQRHPSLAQGLRVTDPRLPSDPFQR
ncbi:MAG TPA: FAD-dependent thymidylate synthase [Terriglobales bacterium]|nr:FAD-dependent thymidylate synthase [Terriglobales bacterium]